MTMTARITDLGLDMPVEGRPSSLARLWTTLRRMLRILSNRRAANRLADLDDALLQDIGLTRGDVDAILRTSPLSEDPTRRLSLVARAHAIRALPPV